jgi:hypothetical protein
MKRKMAFVLALVMAIMLIPVQNVGTPDVQGRGIFNNQQVYASAPWGNRAPMISMPIFNGWFDNASTTLDSGAIVLTANHSNGDEITVTIIPWQPTAEILQNSISSTVDIATIDGSLPAGTLSLIIVNDRVYVPLNFLAHVYDAEVLYDSSTSTFTLSVQTWSLIFNEWSPPIDGARPLIWYDPNAPIPESPENLSAVPGNGQVTLNWTPPPAGTFTGYRIEWNDGIYFLGYDNNVSANVSTYIITGLTNGQTYQFNIYSINGNISSYLASEVTATPQAPVPSRPTNLSAIPGNTQVTLHWTPPAAGTFTGYRIRWTNVSTWVSNTVDIAAGVSSYTVSSLINNQAYNFSIAALNGATPGEFTATVPATPHVPASAPAPAPQPFNPWSWWPASTQQNQGNQPINQPITGGSAEVRNQLNAGRHEVGLNIPANQSWHDISARDIENIVAGGANLSVTTHDGSLGITFTGRCLRDAGIAGQGGLHVGISKLDANNPPSGSYFQLALQTASGEITVLMAAQFTVSQGGSRITDFITPVTLSLDVSGLGLTADQYSKLVGVRINPDGTITELPGLYNPATGTFSFETNSLSIYGVALVERAAASESRPPQVVISAPRTVNRLILTIGSLNYFHNDELKSLVIAPEIINDRTMVPLRFVAEGLGAHVAWDEPTETAYIFLDGKNIPVTVGLLSEGMDTPAINRNGSILVPLRYVGEAFGCRFEFDSVVQTVYIERNIS